MSFLSIKKRRTENENNFLNLVFNFINFNFFQNGRFKMILCGWSK